MAVERHQCGPRHWVLACKTERGVPLREKKKKKRKKQRKEKEEESYITPYLLK